MKCNNCQAEWTPPSGKSITSCPFCSEPITTHKFDSKSIKMDSIISFGSYDWRVLYLQNDKALILTENIVDKRLYNNEKENVTWATCTLRNYLNNVFLNMFTIAEQRRIEETRIFNNDNFWYKVKGGSDTIDKIFLLSLEEADKYFGNSGDYQNKIRKKTDVLSNWVQNNDGHCINNNDNKNRVAYLNNEICWWWLRSPGHDNCNAAFVCKDGCVDVDGRSVCSEGGVRPALWLNL